MGDVIDFDKFRQRRWEESLAEGWNFLDQVFHGLEDDTATFTLTFIDESGNLVYSSDEDK